MGEIEIILKGSECKPNAYLFTNHRYPMRTTLFIPLAFLFCFACQPEMEEKPKQEESESVAEMKFDKTKWAVKDGEDYPFRDQMVDDVLYNDTVRTLNGNEILQLLGKPDRTNEGHLYYRITETRLGFWMLHAKTLVIKLSADQSIDWIKLHD